MFFFCTAYWVVLTNLQFSIQHLESRSVVIFFFLLYSLSVKLLMFLFSCGILYLPYVVIFLVSSFEVNDLSVPIYRLNLELGLPFH